MPRSLVSSFLAVATVAVPMLLGAVPSVADVPDMPPLEGSSQSNILNVSLQRHGKAVRPQNAVDLHLVLAIDNSSSIGDDEFTLMMKGYRDSFLSGETKRLLDDGGTRAVSIMFYGSYSYHAHTEIVHKGNVHAFVNRVFWDLTTNQARPRPTRFTYGGTDITLAQKLIMKLFANEALYGFTSEANRRVVFSGDECPNPAGVAVLTRSLAQKYGAVVHAMPVILPEHSDDYPKESQLYREFAGFLATPRGLKTGHLGFPMGLPKGKTSLLSSFGEVKNIMPVALNLGGF